MYNDMAQLWVRSSPGRAPPWHGGGSEFDPRRIHQLEYKSDDKLIALYKKSD